MAERRAPAILCGTLFIAAGILHFAMPAPYVRIVPPYLPAHEALVAISGAAEIAGGVGLMLARTRRAAGIGLLALLAAVFPANIFMAVDASAFRDMAPPAVLYARLPLQPLLAWWIWRIVRSPR